MKVEICKDGSLWDSYVEKATGSCNYHRWVWGQVIEETFGHRPYYLSASADGAIQGVLPLVFLKSRLFGKSLVSVPFFTYGGVLAGNAEARASLLEYAAGLAQELGAHHIELRQGTECDVGWADVTPKVTMVVPLPVSTAELWKGLSTGMRNKIRNAQKHGLRAQWGGAEEVAHFYPVFATNMRNLGTPVYPREWFANQCCHCPEIRVLTLWDDHGPIAGAFLTPFHQTLELPWSASLPESRKKYSHVLLYWTFLEWALENGYRTVDLGRCTPGSGTHEFKRHWNCVERLLHWYYWLPSGRSLPQLRADNPRFHLATEVWKHLPLFVANGLGPRIVRSIP